MHKQINGKKITKTKFSKLRITTTIEIYLNFSVEETSSSSMKSFFNSSEISESESESLLWDNLIC